MVTREGEEQQGANRSWWGNNEGRVRRAGELTDHGGVITREGLEEQGS